MWADLRVACTLVEPVDLERTRSFLVYAHARECMAFFSFALKS
jgi:hypothetical protein